MKVIDKPDAERLTSLMGGLDHAIGVFDRIAHRLFAQDMTAHLEGAYRLLRMHVVWGRDDSDIGLTGQCLFKRLVDRYTA